MLHLVVVVERQGNLLGARSHANNIARCMMNPRQERQQGGRSCGLCADAGNKFLDDHPRLINAWFLHQAPSAFKPFVDLLWRSRATRRWGKAKLFRGEIKHCSNAAQFAELIELSFPVLVGTQGTRLDLQGFRQLFLGEPVFLSIVFEGLPGERGPPCSLSCHAVILFTGTGSC